MLADSPTVRLSQPAALACPVPPGVRPAALAAAQALAMRLPPGWATHVMACASRDGDLDFAFRRGANDCLEVRARADGRLDYCAHFFHGPDLAQEWGADGLTAERFPVQVIADFLRGTPPALLRPAISTPTA